MADGTRPTRRGPKPVLAGAALRKAIMAIWCVGFCGMQWRAVASSATSRSARCTHCSRAGPGGCGAGCSTGCAGHGGWPAGILPNPAPSSSTAAPAARHRAASRAASTAARRSGASKSISRWTSTVASGWRSSRAVIHAGSVIAAVAQEEFDWLGDLVEQRTYLGGIINIAVGQDGGDDPAAHRVEADVQRGTPLAGAVFLHSPGPPSFRPELSTSRWIAPPGARGCAGSSRL